MPELDPANFDPAVLLTLAGGTIAAGIVASIIEALKRLPGVGPIIDAKREPGAATILSFLVVGYAHFTTVVDPLDPIKAFTSFVAALGVSALASKAHDLAATARAGVSGGTP